MKKLSKNIIIALLCVSCFSGCLFNNTKLPNFNFDSIIPVNNTTEVKDSRNLIPKIVDSLKKASKEDCLASARVYYGAAEYLKHTDSITSTADLIPPTGLMRAVTNTYKLDVGKNKEFTDLLEYDMKENLKIKTPKKIDDTLKQEIIDTFTVYAEGCIKAANSK